MRQYGWLVGFAALAGYVAGCNSEPEGVAYSDSEQNVADDEHMHAHEHGPHDGHVVELADDHSVHGEFVVDKAAGQAKFYVLGADLKTPAMASAVTFHAEGENGEGPEIIMQPAGGGATASEFTAPLADLPSQDIEALHGHFHVTMDGKELAGDLSHDHEGHDHGDHSHNEASEAK